MNAKRCDRCQGYYDIPSNGRPYKLIRSVRVTSTTIENSIDLCNSCYADLVSWLEEKEGEQR